MCLKQLILKIISHKIGTLRCRHYREIISYVLMIKVTEKTFQEMYINVGMANCEKRPKQERDDIRFTHIAIPTSFYILFVILKVCVLLEHVLISYTGGVCYLWVLEASFREVGIQCNIVLDDAYRGVLGGHVA